MRSIVSATARISVMRCSGPSSCCSQIWCGKQYLDEKEVLEVVVKNSPKNFHEFKIFSDSDSLLLPEDLELFFCELERSKTK